MLKILPLLPQAKGYILAAMLSCATQPAPVVNFDFKNNDPVFYNSRSSRELLAMRAGSTSPNYGQEFPIVGGITDSNIIIDYSLGFTDVSERDSGSHCLWIKSADIKITYSPAVYVASNYKPASCRYDMTQQHELMHVGVDVITLKELVPRIKKAVEDGLSRDYGIGPFNKETLPQSEDALSKKLADIMAVQVAELQRTRTLRQQQVDSKDEYRRLSEACTNEPAR